ncbi:hypothetical protein J4Y60_21400, partial [Escherichia coli]
AFPHRRINAAGIFIHTTYTADVSVIIPDAETERRFSFPSSYALSTRICDSGDVFLLHIFTFFTMSGKVNNAHIRSCSGYWLNGPDRGSNSPVFLCRAHFLN